MSDDKNTEEKVDHPRHYNQHPSGVEAIVLCEQVAFNIGTAWKYLFRYGLKAGEAEETDFRKARWYLAREVARTDTRSTMEWSYDEWFAANVSRVILADKTSVLARVLDSWSLSTPGAGDTADAMLDAFDKATDGRFMPKKEKA